MANISTDLLRIKSAIYGKEVRDAIIDSFDKVNEDAESRESKSSKGIPNGIAELDTNGKVPLSQIPDITITDTFVADSQNTMLAVDAQKGDVVIRTDINQTFILKEPGADTLSNWQVLPMPTIPVTSVAGKTGNIILTKDDVGLSNDFTIADGGTVAGTDAIPSKNEFDISVYQVDEYTKALVITLPIDTNDPSGGRSQQYMIFNGFLYKRYADGWHNGSDDCVFNRYYPSGNFCLRPSICNIIRLSNTGNADITFSEYGTYHILLTPDGTHTVSFPEILWQGGIAPTFENGNTYEIIITYDGTNYYGGVIAYAAGQATV